MPLGLVSTFSIVEAVIICECDFLIFLEGLVAVGSDVVRFAAVFGFGSCLHFFSSSELVLGTGCGGGTEWSVAFLSLRPSFFQAGT